MVGENADPLHCPRSGCSTYTVYIYNKDVRAKLKENRPHDMLSERWAEVQPHEVTAHDPDEARRLATDRFPVREGFVITEIFRADA